MNEYSSPTNFDYKMLDSTVLYRWHKNRNFLKFNIGYLDTVQKVFLTQFFGSWESAHSEGINVYTGVKSSYREIGNPLTAPTHVPFQKPWTSTGEITYHPVVKNVPITLHRSCLM